MILRATVVERNRGIEARQPEGIQRAGGMCLTQPHLADTLFHSMVGGIRGILTKPNSQALSHQTTLTLRLTRPQRRILLLTEQGEQILRFLIGTLSRVRGSQDIGSLEAATSCEACA